jgi:CRP-like cAMP-binding protein
LIQCPPGTCVHRRGEPVTAIYLIIHGRLRVSVADLQGRQIMDRYQGAGGQFGGVAAALAEQRGQRRQPRTRLARRHARRWASPSAGAAKKTCGGPATNSR